MNPGSGYADSQNTALKRGKRNEADQDYDWTGMLTSFLGGAGQGISGGLGAGNVSSAAKDATEARRRTIADMIKRSMGRDRTMMAANQRSSSSGQDLDNEIMQEMAKGFVDAMRGG
jgi:hypothetical protein